MFDIHAHLHDVAYDSDRDEIVRRASDSGVTKIITIGTDLEECRKAVVCAEKYEGVFASVGIHPDELHRISEGATLSFLEGELRKLAMHEKVIAIGECGLDYFSHGTEVPVTEEEKSSQKEGFLMQIRLALRLDLPLIVHTRPSAGTMDAYENLVGILSDTSLGIRQLPIILHCYMGDTEVTRQFFGFPNVYFSFTGNITYPVKKAIAGTAGDSAETVKMIPIERILAETDCPYLAPVPYRGQRNEPASVREVYCRVAEIKGIEYTEVEWQIERNVCKVFPQMKDE